MKIRTNQIIRTVQSTLAGITTLALALIALTALTCQVSAQTEPALLWGKVSGPWASEFDGSFGAIAVHPTNPNIVLAASSAWGPGIFKSADGGTTWTAKNSGLTQSVAGNCIPIAKIMFSLSNPNILYAAAASDDGFGGSYGGVFKSVNTGESWQKLNIPGGGVYDMDVHPQNADIVYAGVTGRGILKTTDGGNTWSTMYPGSSFPGAMDYFNTVRILPSQPQTVLFSGFTFYDEDVVPGILWEDDLTTVPGTQGAIPFPLRKSTDGGATWKTIPDPSSFGMFTDLQIESATGDLYMSTIAYMTPVFIPVGNRGIFRSADAGETWTAVNNATFGQLDQMPFVALSSNPSTVNKGIFASTGLGGLVIASTNTGNNWFRLDPCFVPGTYIGKTAVAGNKFYATTTQGIFFTDISSLYAPAAAVINSISPATLPPSSSPQLITLTGTGFLPPTDPNASTLVITDPAGNIYARTPNYVSATALSYNITVQSATGSWKVAVANGAVLSQPYSFTVATGSTELIGLVIGAPTAVSKNSTDQLTATAFFSDGSQQTVTASANWSVNSSSAAISSSGLLTAGNVSGNTAIVVSANCTIQGVTKTASATVTVINATGCGVTQTNLTPNGNCEAGASGWTLSGGAQITTYAGFAHTGSYYVWLGGAVNEVDSAYITVTIPSAATAASLGFFFNENSQEGASIAYDTASASVRSTSGAVLATIKNWSNINQDAGGGNPYYHQVTFDMLPYVGQTVRIFFSSTNDSTAVTNFRFDDLSLMVTVPNPPTPVLFGVGGPSNVLEASSAQYNAILVMCNDSIQPVTPVWSVNSSAATISSSGQLMTGNVNNDTVITISASYNGTTLNYPVTIVNVVPVLSSIAINGPTSINENSSGQLTATAIFSDQSSQPAAVTWSVNSSAMTVSSSGVMIAGEVASDTVVTVLATCTVSGVTRTASQQITIRNIALPPPLTSLIITGPATVDENDSVQYSAVASFGDGSSQVVNPTWNQNLPAASISPSGVFAVGGIPTNTPVVISATFTSDGVTCTATQNITVSYVAPPPVTLGVQTSSDQIILSWPTNFVGFSLQFTTNLYNQGWTTCQDVPTINGQNYVVSNTIGSGCKFYRLKK